MKFFKIVLYFVCVLTVFFCCSFCVLAASSDVVDLTFNSVAVGSFTYSSGNQILSYYSPLSLPAPNPNYNIGVTLVCAPNTVSNSAHAFYFASLFKNYDSDSIHYFIPGCSYHITYTQRWTFTVPYSDDTNFFGLFDYSLFTSTVWLTNDPKLYNNNGSIRPSSAVSLNADSYSCSVTGATTDNNRVIDVMYDLIFTVPDALSQNVFSYVVLIPDFYSACVGFTPNSYDNAVWQVSFRYYLTDIVGEYDPTGDNPFGPASPPDVDDFVPLHAGNYSINAHGVGDLFSSVTGSRLPVWDIESNQSYDGYILAADLDYTALVDDTPTRLPYYLQSGQVYKGYFVGMFSTEGASGAFNPMNVVSYIVISDDYDFSGTPPDWYKIVDIVSFDSFNQVVELYPTNGDPNFSTFFTVTFYFQLPNNFDSLYGDDFNCIGLYLDFSNCFDSFDSFSIACTFNDLDLNSGVDSPDPDPSYSPTFGQIDNIANRPLDPRYPSGSDYIGDLDDLERSVLDPVTGALGDIGDINSGVLDLLSDLGDGFSFFGGLFDLSVSSLGFGGILTVSLLFGVFMLILNFTTSAIK